jgi:hypothetical protein
MLVGFGALTMAAVAALPVVHSIQQKLAALKAFWDLWPLWNELSDVVPDITFVAPRSRLVDIFYSPHPLSWRLSHAP